MGKNGLSLMIGGHAGQGVKTVGDTFARLCARAGLYVFVNQEYPSNIKGEHLHMHLTVSGKPARSQNGPVNVMLALDAKSVVVHERDLLPGGALIYDSEGLEYSPLDSDLKDNVKVERDDILVLDLPMLEIAKEVGGSKRMVNSAGVGAIHGLTHLDFELLEKMLRESLAKLGDETVQKNVDAARKMYEHVREEHAGEFDVALEAVEDAPKRMLLTGNEALGMGAIKAGLKFYAAYPMTPSSSLLSYLARNAREQGILVKLSEDEISAAGMAVGASFAGVRAMTGTSGGGYCLMSEFIGLAGMCEVPLVVLEGQRPGPATGMPTRTEQGDLKFVINAHQGEFPRIVLAPGDPREAFELGFKAFNLADRCHTPVVLLMDKHLCECSWTYEPFETKGMEIDRGKLLNDKKLAKLEEFRPFLVTETGVSPRSRPGLRGGVYKVTSDEHDEYGQISEEADNKTAQTEKRLRKMNLVDVDECGIKIHGDEDADITLVSWGSTKPVILDVMVELEEDYDIHCNFLQILYANPFPAKQVTEVLEKAKQTIGIENNATAQMMDIVREQTGIAVDHKVLKYSGRQFHRDELVGRLKEILAS